MDRGAWRATVHGVAESHMTELLSTHIHIFLEGHYSITVTPKHRTLSSLVNKGRKSKRDHPASFLSISYSPPYWVGAWTFFRSTTPFANLLPTVKTVPVHREENQAKGSTSSYGRIIPTYSLDSPCTLMASWSLLKS